MPVIARYDLTDTVPNAADSALGNGAQNGLYTDGAASTGGQAVLDGINDKVKIFSDPAFQLDRGTLEIQFSQAEHNGDGPNTIVSRDSTGTTDGGYRAEVNADGSITVTHESTAGSFTYSTDAGFVNPGDDITLTYSWDQAQGGYLSIENATTGASATSDTPPGLTMDQGGENQTWMIGAGQSNSDPFLLNNLNAYLEGSVEYFQISDSVDNVPDDRDGLVFGTDDDDLIDGDYAGDPDGDFVDNGDALLDPGPNDDRIFGFDGNDTIQAGDGNDLVYGGTGDDRAAGSSGSDTIYGQQGDDRLSGGTDDDSLSGGAGNDEALGGSGDDTLSGGTGDDDLTGGSGSDSVRGGQGDDSIVTGGANPLPDLGYPGLYPADADPLNDLDTVYGGYGDDTIRTGDDRDVIFGGADNDDIDGGFDNDTISGGLGDDTVVGNEGADEIRGKSGDDLIYGGLDDSFPEAVNIPDAAGDLVTDNNTDLIYGGLGADTIYGRDDDDTIYGGFDNDVIDGGVDEDDLYGNRGNDTLRGGEGADSVYGGADRDLIVVDVRGNGVNDQVDGNEGGDDFDTLDLRGSGPLSIVYADDNPENGTVTFLDADGNPTGTLDFVNIENVIPCFTPGTLIATPRGEIPVEELRAGDKVVTRDNGIQEIAWTGSKHLDWGNLQANPHLKPVLIRKGSLGEGLPERDMIVSPNHRMLVANDRTALYFEDHEVLVAAKHLVSGRGVMGIESAGVTYLHFMFERHEVVLADGAWTESFQPGDYTLKGMGNGQRQEIFELFPELKTIEGLGSYTAARRTLKKHEAALLRV